MTRAWPLVAAVLTLALGSAAYAANAAVTIRNASFMPASVTVNVGESVTWTNQDGIAHSARADDGSFDTGVFSTGSRTVTFRGAGTFGYFCAVHPAAMRGTVRAIGAATPPPTTPPTVPPTPPPTVPPTPVPRTPAPATASPSPSPSPSPSASPSPSPSPAPATAPVVAQATASTSPAATATAGSRPDEGPRPIAIGAVALVVAALAGGALLLARRA